MKHCVLPNEKTLCGLSSNQIKVGWFLSENNEKLNNRQYNLFKDLVDCEDCLCSAKKLVFDKNEINFYKEILRKYREFDEELSIKFQDNGLMCPYCEFNNLHQEKVIVNFRELEDSDKGINVSVNSNLNYTISNKIDNNSSGRQDGISIEFSCENCKNKPILYIYQHNGFNLINWTR